MSFKDISYLELWRPLEPFMQYGKGHYLEHFCEII